MKKIFGAVASLLLVASAALGAGGLNYPGGITTSSSSGCVRYDASTNPRAFFSTGIACHTANAIQTKTFAALGTPADGTTYYCSDCTQATPCAGSGTGAFAQRVNGAWQCSAGGGGSSAFASLTSGTNTTAAMVVGSGASLAPGGSGTIIATSGDSATGFFSSGTLETARGGTNQTSWTAGNCVRVNGAADGLESFSEPCNVQHFTLDLADDGSNESTALGEIATIGDTNSIVTEPGTDKMLINMGNDWPKADTSDDLTCTNCIGMTEFDESTVGTTTWGDGVGSDTWTINVGGADDPSIDFSTGQIRILNGDVQTIGESVYFLNAGQTAAVFYDDATSTFSAYGGAQIHATNVPGPVFNVKDDIYGALGDGVTDDTTAIRAAITAASVAGGTVFFPCGTYVVTKPAENGALEINTSNITLRGASRDCAVLTYPNTTTDNALIAVCESGAANCNNITIRDLTLDGNGANWSATGAHYGILVSNLINTTAIANHGLIDNLLVKNFGNATNTSKNPIQLDRLWNNWTVQNSVFLTNERGINMSCFGTVACTSGKILNNYFDQASAAAATTNDYNIQTGAVAAAPLTNVVIHGNVCDGTCHGRCIVANGAHMTISSNIADDCAADQIIATISSGQAPLTNVTMSNNIARNGSDGGFGFEAAAGLAGCKSCAFTGNLAYQNDVAGLYVVDTTDLTITGNTFDGNGLTDATADAGIYLVGVTAPGVTRTMITGNAFSDSRGTPDQKHHIQIPSGGGSNVTGTVISGNSYGTNEAGGTPISIADAASSISTAVNEPGNLAVTFTQLATHYDPTRVVDGSRLWCDDCTASAPCSGSGSGAVAQQIAGVWNCNSTGITELTAGSGGATTGNSVNIAGDNAGIRTVRSGDTVTVQFHPEDVAGSKTWSNGSGNVTWTVDVASGTDPALQFSGSTVRALGNLYSRSTIPSLSLEDTDQSNAVAGVLNGECGSSSACDVFLTNLVGGTQRTILGQTGAGALSAGSANTTAITLTTDGTGNAEVVLPDNSVNLASGAGQEVTGTLPLANGGTGQTSWTAGNCVRVNAGGTALEDTGVACGSGSGGMTSFTLAGTSGTPQTITDGNTLTVAAGTGITTTAGATDTVTVAATLGTSIDLASEVGSTVLPIANGGTGTASTLTGLVRGSGSAMTAAELSGDATTSGSNVVTVVDDSHAHTSSSISGIDISADTNLTAGAGLLLTGDDLATASTEAGFVDSADISSACGSGNGGKVAIHSGRFAFCDYTGTPTHHYLAYGDVSNNALTGDSATSFFSTGTIEAARLPEADDDATTKGIATFNNTNFDATSGVVTIASGGVGSTEIADGSIATGDLAFTPATLSFTAIDTQNGTDPAADSATDTLSFAGFGVDTQVTGFDTAGNDQVYIGWNYDNNWATVDPLPGRCVATDLTADSSTLLCVGGTNAGTLCSDGRECRGGGTCTGTSPTVPAKGGFICPTHDSDTDHTVLIFDRVSAGNTNKDAFVHVPFRSGTIAVQGDIGLTISKGDETDDNPSGGVVSFEYTNTLAGNVALNAGECIFASGSTERGILCEGSGADTNETALLFANPGADTTVTVPATTGTLITTGDTGTVSSTMVADGTLLFADMADQTDGDLNVTSGVPTLIANSVTNVEIAADTILHGDIATDAVRAAEIQADAVGSSEIAADAVGTSEIATDGVGLAEIAANSVDASELVATGVTGTTCQNCNLTYDADGRISSASNGVLAAAFKIKVDKNGLDDDACGSEIAPCQTLTGTDGAIARLNALNDNGALTCTNDPGTACSRCSGTAATCEGGANDGASCASSTACPGGVCTSPPCNSPPGYDSDCADNKICSALTCKDDPTLGCAFYCSSNTCIGGTNAGGACATASACPSGTCSPRECLYDTDCGEGGGTCGEADVCRVCAGGSNANAPCTTNSECPGSNCSGDGSTFFPGFCSTGGSRAGLTCTTHSDCFDSTCGTSSSTKYCTLQTANVTNTMCSVCVGGTNDGVGCTVDSQCPSGVCGHTNGGFGTPALCTGTQKTYAIELAEGEFSECLDRSSATKTIPPPGNIVISGQDRFATALVCNAPAGNGLAVDLTDRKNVYIKDLSINTAFGGTPIGSRGGANVQTINISANQSLAGSSCIGGANSAATCTVDSECPNGYCRPDPQILLSGRGNQTITLDNTWSFGTISGSPIGVLMEKWPNSVCVNDPTRACEADGHCTSGVCTSRSCVNERWKPCAIDEDCTSGAFGACSEPLHARAIGAEGAGGSADLWIYKSMLQPDSASALVGGAVEIRGMACGGTGFNEKIIDSMLYSGGASNSGLVLTSSGTDQGNADCGAQQPRIGVENSRIVNLATGGALGTSVNVGANTILDVSNFDYDARTRTIGAASGGKDAGVLQYTGSLLGGGKSWLGVLTANPSTPVNGECWVLDSTTDIIRCHINGTTGPILVNPSTATGDLLIGAGAVSTATALAIGANNRVLTSNGTTPGWTDVSTGGGPFTGYQLKAGATGAQTLVLSTNNTGALTLATGNNNGTITMSTGNSTSSIIGGTNSTLQVTGGTTGGADLYLNSSTGTDGDIGFNCDTGNANCQHVMSSAGRFSINAADCSTPGNAELCVNGGLTVATPGNSLANAVVTRTATQTLTNKTLTSPTITTPVLTLEQGTSPATADGRPYWETTKDLLSIGAGSIAIKQAFRFIGTCVSFGGGGFGDAVAYCTITNSTNSGSEFPQIVGTSMACDDFAVNVSPDLVATEDLVVTVRKNAADTSLAVTVDGDSATTDCSADSTKECGKIHNTVVNFGANDYISIKTDCVGAGCATTSTILGFALRCWSTDD